MTGLRIGILVDGALKHQYLGEMVVQAGHAVGYSYLITPATHEPDLNQQVDAWVVDVCEPDDHESEQKHRAENEKARPISDWLNLLLEQTHLPIVVNDSLTMDQNSPEYIDWVRRMLQRLERLNGDINLQAANVAKDVWVLGASTGGPAAVKDFVQQLPAGLNIAFVYVQHIDVGQAATLIKMMSSVGHYPASIAKQGTVLTKNSITLVTGDRSLHIHENGSIVINKKSWSGFYAPSIDQVAANVARVYKKRSGIIIFSGMGDDGAASSRLIKQQGGKVWVQTPEQCTISSMPDAALATGTVTFNGTPVELAVALGNLKRRR